MLRYCYEVLFLGCWQKAPGSVKIYINQNDVVKDRVLKVSQISEIWKVHITLKKYLRLQNGYDSVVPTPVIIKQTPKLLQIVFTVHAIKNRSEPICLSGFLIRH